MKIALIGCGSAGQDIAIQVTKLGGFDEIILADFKISKAIELEKILKKINISLEYTSHELDASNIKKIKNILRGVKIVINAASPICNIPIMKACLNTKTHYIDLASDPFRYSGMVEGTSLEEQLELDEKFLKNDLIAITNTGFSPGFTDVLCRYVVDKYSLNAINSIKIYFGEVIEADRLIVGWSPYILLLETISPPTVYKDKNIETLSPFGSTKKIKFPDPIGELKVRPFNGHPELKTIPEFINIPVEYIEIGGGIRLNEMEINDVIVEALSEIVSENINIEGDIFEILSKAFENPEKFAHFYKKGNIKKEIFCCLFEINGTKNGKTIRYTATIEHDLVDIIEEISTASVATYIVSFTPTIILDMLMKGKINERGVIAPAGLNCASSIIKEAKEMGLNLKDKIEINPTFSQ